jgi:hypothetical protein
LAGTTIAGPSADDAPEAVVERDLDAGKHLVPRKPS